MSEIKKEYLGDSVYAQWYLGGIWLTTENGMGPSNSIYLEPEVYRALLRFYEHSNQENTNG